VSGCRTTGPHAGDPIVQGLILQFAPPEKMAIWTRVAIAELRESICRDMAENRVFAWYSRLRLPEELYVRTLYALFIATDKELIHILSGVTPNDLSPLYSKVNEVVFEGRGLLQASQPGLKQGTFRPINILHDGAHGSFPAFMACIGLSRNPQNVPSPERHGEHLQRYCAFLDYMHGMFKAGKTRPEVLAAVKQLHRPAKVETKEKS